MTIRRALLGLVTLLVAAAYLAGYWPEHRRLVEVSEQVAVLQTQVGNLEARERLARILGHLLRLADAVEASNFGDAAQQATAYFDRAAEEALTVIAPDQKGALDDILRSRDRVVAALALNDPTVLQELRRHEIALRRALGYAVP
jgi:hypothetical protein